MQYLRGDKGIIKIRNRKFVSELILNYNIHVTMKKPTILLFLAILVTISISSIISSDIYRHYIKQARLSVFEECAGHAKGNRHYHARIQITQNGKNITVPENIGITGECIHPLHTHNTTGLIHMDYPKKFDFTLGDFFDIQGIILNDKQIGSIKTYDGYKIIVKINNKIITKDLRHIILKDLDTITIQINK